MEAMEGEGITHSHYCIMEIQDVLSSLSLFLALESANLKQQHQAMNSLEVGERSRTAGC